MIEHEHKKPLNNLLEHQVMARRRAIVAIVLTALLTGCATHRIGGVYSWPSRESPVHIESVMVDSLRASGYNSKSRSLGSNHHVIWIDNILVSGIVTISASVTGEDWTQYTIKPDVQIRLGASAERFRKALDAAREKASNEPI